jgi:hypothetical protein
MVASSFRCADNRLNEIVGQGLKAGFIEQRRATRPGGWLLGLQGIEHNTSLWARLGHPRRRMKRVRR